jgi:hypothetical protein
MATTTSRANVVSNSVNSNASVASKSATAATANVVGKTSADKSADKPKTQRVLETRQAWDVVFNHMASLVASLAKGEPLCENPRDGFAFGKVADQPHIRGYAQGLLAGFVSRKANKFLGEVDGLKTIEERTKIALAILTATKLGGKTTESAKGYLSKAEPKQAKTFSEAVKAALNVVQAVEEPAEVAPTEQAEAEAVAPKEQPKAKKAASPKGKKVADGGNGKRGGKRGSTKAAAKA